MNLVVVQGSMMLDAPAASGWVALESAVQSEYGINLNITSPAGAWRSPEMVLDMYFSSPARRKAVYGVPIGVAVAKPKSLGGNGSVHENGLCVDIADRTGISQKNLVAIAAEHGFTFTISTEPWHMQHSGGGFSSGGSDPTPSDNALLRRRKENSMFVKGTGATVYATFTDANGHLRLRTCHVNEAAYAVAGGLVVEGNDATLTGLGVEAGWPQGGPELVLPLPKVEATVDLSGVQVPAPDLSPLVARFDRVDAAVAAVPAAVIVEQKKPGN